MSNVRPVADFPRNEPGLVDRYIGDAYSVVKTVYDKLPEIKTISNSYESIEEIRLNLDSLLDLLQLLKTEDFKDFTKINKEDLSTICEDLRKGTWNGKRKIDIDLIKYPLDPNKEYTFSIYGEMNEYIGTYSMPKDYRDFYFELRNTLEILYPGELEFILSNECNSKFITITDKGKEFVCQLSNISIESNDSKSYFNWFNSTSSISYLLFKLHYYMNILNRLEDLDIDLGNLNAFLDKIEELMKYYTQLSKDWANKPYGEEVEDGEYSSKHYATESQKILDSVVQVTSAERFVITYHPKVIDENFTIPANMNAFSSGPIIEIAEGVTVTVEEGSTWNVVSKPTEYE